MARDIYSFSTFALIIDHSLIDLGWLRFGSTFTYTRFFLDLFDDVNVITGMSIVGNEAE